MSVWGSGWVMTGRSRTGTAGNCDTRCLSLSHCFAETQWKVFMWLTLLHHGPLLEKVRAVAWWQELLQRLWRGAPYWLTPHGFPNLLSYSTQGTSPGIAPPTKGQVLPMNHEENAPQLYLMEALSRLKFLSDNSSLCQIDVNEPAHSDMQAHICNQSICNPR